MLSRNWSYLLACCAVMILSSASVMGQQPPGQSSTSADQTRTPDSTSAAPQNLQDATAPPATATASDKNGEKKDKDAGTSKDRLFFALPNFLSVANAGQVAPLTTGQKFRVVTRGAFDPVEIPWYMTLAAIGQAQNSEPSYGQGWAGYGKRLGTTAADGVIENFSVGAVFPSLLHQDPRYFYLGQGSFMHRASYAVSRIVITRGDSGKRQFNFSEILGSAVSAGISTYAYHPHADKNIGNAATVWGSLIGYDTITIMLREFWPDVGRKLRRKHAAASENK